jgi:lipopolysaccharide transport system permease protein
MQEPSDWLWHREATDMLKALWRYRHFVLGSIRNELVSRFARSKLGGLWMLINPLAQVAIYALILSNVLAAKLPGIDSQYAYAIYLMAGLLAWTLFSEIITSCLTLFIEQGNLMKKMSFPRITLPAIVVGSSLLNNLLLLLAMLGIFLLLGHYFSPAMLWLLPLTLIVTAFAVGVGLTLGVMNVFLRDIGQAAPIVLQVWFWFTPIVYPITIIPDEYRHWLELNPVYPLVEAYHRVLVYGTTPELHGLLPIAGVALVLLMMAFFLFRRAAEEMVDAL